jgi:hypothetical protein
MGFTTLSYEVALHGYGWRQGRYFDGMACGTRAAAAYVTALRVYSSEFQYRAYLRNEGWSGWRSDGAETNDFLTGTPIEALQFRPVDGASALDLLYQATFGAEFSAIGAASQADVIGTPGSGNSLQVLRIFPVVPVHARSAGDLVLSEGAKLDELVFPGNPSLTGAGHGLLEELNSASIRSPEKSATHRLNETVLQSRPGLAGLGTAAPLHLETAGLICYSGLIVARLLCARQVRTEAQLVEGDLPEIPAGTLIADPALGTALETPGRWKPDTSSPDIRPAAWNLLKAMSDEGRARKVA